jgi:hypothetical protein
MPKGVERVSVEVALQANGGKHSIEQGIDNAWHDATACSCVDDLIFLVEILS